MFGFFYQPQTASSMTVGMPTRGQRFSFTLNYDADVPELNRSNDVSIQSMQTVLDTSAYVAKRYQAVDVQAMIAEEMGISTNNLSAIDPFYTVLNQGFGYVNLTFQSTDASQVDQFEAAVQTAHAAIIEEWNTGRTEDFMIDETPQFPSWQYQVDPNIQSLMIPVFAAFMIGLAAIVMWPVRQ